MKALNIFRFVSLDKKAAAFFAVAAVALTLASLSKGQIITETEYNEGWIGNSPLLPNNPANQDTFAGTYANTYSLNDFFSFNLAGVTPGTITGATLNLSGGYNEFTGTGTYNIYASTIDPTTSPSDYSGLTSGDLIGTATGIQGSDAAADTPTNLTLTLNTQGLADINASAGGNFIIGGSFTGAGTDSNGNSAVFLSSPPSGVANTLTLNIASAPEPSAWAMLLGGLGLLAFWRWRVTRC